MEQLTVRREGSTWSIMDQPSRITGAPSDPQPVRHIRSADFPDELRISAHHKLIACPGQSDVETFAGSFSWLRLVQCQHDDAPFESLEPSTWP